VAFSYCPNIDLKPTISKLYYDFYQVPEYCRIEAEVLNGKLTYWFKEINGNCFLIPLIERNIRSKDTIDKDLVSPYGYPGLIYNESVSKKDYIEAIRQFNIESGNEGYISTFIRLHPIYNSFVINNLPNITQHRHGKTVSVNLNLPVNAIRSGYSQNHKRNIRTLIKKKFSVKTNSWEFFDNFIEVYIGTMKRKNAAGRYLFTNSYFYKLKEVLGDQLILISVHNMKNELVAGGLFTIVKGLAQFHLGGTAENAIELSPSKLMIDGAIETCKARGAHILHLGGGYGSSATDGLYRFKSGFGTSTQFFNTLRFIHNPDKYHNLLNSTKINVSGKGDFFPEYRLISGTI